MPFAPPKHRPTAGTKRHSVEEQDALKRQARRQYRTNSSTWRKARAIQLAKEPLCRDCQAEGVITPATVVDHIDGDSWNNTPDNFASLCVRHHNQKTARENGGFGRIKK